MRNVAAAWVAPSVIATADLKTLTQPDDHRINRAFAGARQAVHADATLEHLANGREIRRSRVLVRAPTEAEAVDQVTKVTSAMAADFDTTGPGQLYVDVRRRGTPVLDARAILVQRSLQVGALATGLLGLLFVLMAFRVSQSGEQPLPASAWWGGVIIIGLPLAVLMLGGHFIVLMIMFIPTAIAAGICYKVTKTRQAARWPSTTARILVSRMRVERRSHMGDATKVANVPSVEYEFTLGGTRYLGSRISAAGDSAGPDAQATLDRFPVGATVPVYYNPQDPKDAVLDHDLPVSAPAMYSIAGAIFMAGVAAAAVFAKGDVLWRDVVAMFPRERRRKSPCSSASRHCYCS